MQCCTPSVHVEALDYLLTALGVEARQVRVQLETAGFDAYVQRFQLGCGSSVPAGADS